MALPRFLYGDPSKNVDFLRRERAKYEARQQQKPEKAKEGLEKLFRKGAASNEQK